MAVKEKQLGSLRGDLMKVKIAEILVIFIMITSLAGCKGADALGQYNNAVGNTNSIRNASESSEFHIKLDTARSNLTDKMRNQLEIYSDIRGSTAVSFDRDKNIIKMKGHVDIKSIGFDFEIYENKDKTVILFPLFPKYMVINKKEDSEGFMGLYFGSGKIGHDILSKSITKENIKKLGGSIMFMPEGEIKANNYDISVTGDVIKSKYKAITDYILSSSDLRNFITEVLVNANINGINNSNNDAVFSGLADKLNMYAESVEYGNTTYNAAWDKDFILREEKENFDINYKIDSENTLKINISSTTKRWNIGRNTDIGMIDLSGGNSFSINEIDENLPPFYKSILKSLTAFQKGSPGR
jgi:hypothetical protein